VHRIPLLLLAAGESSAKTGDKLAEQETGFGWQGMAVAAVAVFAVTAAFWWFKRWRAVRAERLTNCPAHLLQEVCVRHGLSGPDQRLLASLARELHLENPAQLFVDPRLWELSRLGPSAKRHAAQLGRMRERIFEL
jgi:hypothetical protein